VSVIAAINRIIATLTTVADRIAARPASTAP